MTGKLFVVSACSGAGKTSLVTQVIDRLTSSYAISRLITYTTKNPRTNEVNGKDYHFVSIEKFKAAIEEKFFLEWSDQYGDYYGSPSGVLDDLGQGKSFIVITDVQGAQSIAKRIEEAILIWIYVKDLETIQERLFARKSENNDEIHKRLLIAQQEVMLKELQSTFHYSILNDSFETAVLELELIVKNVLNNASKTALKTEVLR